MDAVSFQDDRGSLAARLAIAEEGRKADETGSAAKAESSARRLTPEKKEFVFMVGFSLARFDWFALLGRLRASTPMP